MGDSDWWAPLPWLPLVAEAAHALAFGSCQEAPGKQTWWLSPLRETPLSPALSCKGALARNQAKKGTAPSHLLRGNLPLHVSHLHVERRPVVDTPGIDRPSCAPPVESLGQGLHMLSSAPSSLFPGPPVLRKCAFNCSCPCHALRPVPDGEGTACTAVCRTSLPKEQRSSQSTEPCIGSHILQFYQFSLKGNILISSLSVFYTHLSTGANLGKGWGDSFWLRWWHLASYSLGPKPPALLSTPSEGGGAP